MQPKSLKVIWDNPAKESLKEVIRFIDKDSPTSAKHVKRALLKLSRTIGFFPNKFSAEPLLENLPGNYRSVSKWNWKLVYEVTNSEVIILQVLDTRQDPSKLRGKFKK